VPEHHEPSAAKEFTMSWSFFGGGGLVCAVLVAIGMFDNAPVIHARPSSMQTAQARTDDAVTHAILSGSPVPRDIKAIRRRLQSELGGVLTTHIVANGGHEHPTRRNVMFMCFESYAGPTPAGPADEGDLFLGYFLVPEGDRLVVGSGFVELIAWDRTTHRFNFWELLDEAWHFRGDSQDILDNVATINLGAATPSFTFQRKSSDGTPVLRCSGCHTLGAPIMKEVEAPHNDWWTERDKLPTGSFTLDGETSGLFQRAADASHLSALVKQSAGRLLAARAGSVRTQTLPQQLRSLFSTMEMNLVSDSVPFARREQSGAAVQIPAAFFVDPRLAPAARPVSVDLTVYKNALESVGSRFPSRNSSARETRHAFLVPAPSFIDARAIDGLVNRGTLDEELVADVLAVDMSTPVYSGRRASLIRFVPAAATDAADLRTQLIAALQPAAAGDVAARELLSNLTDPRRTAAAHRAEASALLAASAKAAGSVDTVAGWLRIAAQRRAAIERADTAAHPQGLITENGFRAIFPVQVTPTAETLQLNRQTGRPETQSPR
jgi:hypothetical protein